MPCHAEPVIRGAHAYFTSHSSCTLFLHDTTIISSPHQIYTSGSRSSSTRRPAIPNFLLSLSRQISLSRLTLSSESNPPLQPHPRQARSSRLPSMMRKSTKISGSCECICSDDSRTGTRKFISAYADEKHRCGARIYRHRVHRKGNV